MCTFLRHFQTGSRPVRVPPGQADERLPKLRAPNQEHQIFISYRRDIDMDVVGRLYDRLRDEYFVFYDIKMHGGSRFNDVTLAAVRQAPVVLVVIGRGWMAGAPRLFKRNDWVYRELEEALLREDVLMIPVLVHDRINMPAPELLPRPLRALCHRQAMRLRADAWDRDFDLLVQTIGHHLSPPPSRETRNPRDIAHLCNRDDQMAELEELCERSRPRRSLMCVVPGHPWEGHDGFRRRISREGVLQNSFGLPYREFQIEIRPLQLTSEPDRALALRRALKKALLNSRSLADADLLDALVNVRNPTVFWMDVVPGDVERSGRDVLQILARAWDDLMHRLPGLPARPILLWIDLVHEHPAPNPPMEGAGQLTELAPVDAHHIRRWRSQDDVREVISGHEAAIVRLPENAHYCAPLQPGRLHMERFADAIDSLLKTG
jgi:hypothetical protein